MVQIQEILEQLARMLATMFIVTLFHELGHWGTARAFGMKVDKIVVWFDNRFYLVRAGSFTLGWIPFGGYVSVPELDDRPKYQRLIVMSGGVLGNVVLCNIIGWSGLYSLQFFAGVSIVSAVMLLNVLPIPSFDGGQIAILAYEWIFGSRPGSKFTEWLWCAGVLVLLSIAVYLIYVNL